MEIINKNTNINGEYTATIGFFDGVHKGHQYVIDFLKLSAERKSQKSLIITFKDHPRKILHADYQPKLLTTLSEKLERLETLNVDSCVVLNFTKEMASMEAYDFMDYLKKNLHVSSLLVGYDHHFGHNRKETFEDYKQYGEKLGIEVINVDRYNFSENISSSEIRRALEKGNISSANKMLGYAYSFTGKVIRGFKVGRKIGFPTANILPDNQEKLIPEQGVYAVHVKLEKEYHYGMLNIGFRPTFNYPDQKSIEVHILNFHEDIYDKSVEINFIEKIRDEKKFNSVNELISQLEEDRVNLIKKYSI